MNNKNDFVGISIENYWTLVRTGTRYTNTVTCTGALPGASTEGQVRPISHFLRTRFGSFHAVINTSTKHTIRERKEAEKMLLTWKVTGNPSG